MTNEFDDNFVPSHVIIKHGKRYITHKIFEYEDGKFRTFCGIENRISKFSKSEVLAQIKDGKLVMMLSPADYTLYVGENNMYYDYYVDRNCHICFRQTIKSRLEFDI